MIYGLLLSGGIYLVSLFISTLIPTFNIGIVTLSLLLGILLGNTLPEKITTNCLKGIKFSEKYLLEFSIALMGLQLNFNYVLSTGSHYIGYILLIIPVTFIFSIKPFFISVFVFTI